MKSILSGLTGLALASAAFAAQVQPAAGVTLQQFQAERRNQLMRLDTDHDGRISAAEWAARPANGRGDPARQFARLDTNHDGFLTPDEIDSLLAIRFNRLDANHDGVLSPEELAAARAGAPGRGGR